MMSDIEPVTPENIIQRLEARYLMLECGTRRQISDTIAAVRAEMRKEPPKMTFILDRVAMTITVCYGFPEGTGQKAIDKLKRNIIRRTDGYGIKAINQYGELISSNPYFHTIYIDSEEK